MESTLVDCPHLVSGATMIVETCLQVQSSETVAVLVDTPNWRVGMALANAIQAVGAEPVVMTITPRSAHGENPPEPVVSALLGADAAILAASYSLASSPARLLATKAGIRLINIPGCSEAVFESPAMGIDFMAMRPLVERLGALLARTREVRITSAAGTDLRLELCGRDPVVQTGLAHHRGAWSPLPNIETAVGPRRDGVNGVFVVDGVLIPGGIPRQPVRMEIKAGAIIAITGNEEAKIFDRLLDRYADPNMRQVVELGLGLNPKSRLGRGLMAEDESQWGTVHLGIGEGRTFGVDNPAPAHVDVVALKPTIMFDDQPILNEGIYLLEGFEDARTA